jgi:hypothetical protein
MSDKETIETYLADKSLEDLAPEALPVAGDNPDALTESQIARVITALKAHWSPVKIKQVARDNFGVGISFSQIREIRRAWRKKLAELTPAEEEV